jgi:hypothetical protein
MATTLLDVANDRLTQATAEKTAAGTALANAQTALATAQTEQSTAADAAAQLDAKAAEIRVRLAAAPMPSDAQALVIELEQVILDSRAQQAAILKAADDMNAAQQQVDESNIRAQLADSALVAATAEQTVAKADDDARTTWKSLANASTLPADATAKLASPEHTAAATKLLDYVPAPLLGRARERAAKERKRLADLGTDVEKAEDKLTGELKTKGGLSGAVEHSRVAFRRGEGDLRQFAASAKESFDRASSLLNTVAAAPPLPPAEQADIQQAVADAQNTDDAFAAEKDRDDAANKLEAAKQDLEAKRLDKLADPTVDTTVEEGKVTTAAGVLQTKQDALAPLQGKLDKAEASVPDAAWRLVAAFDEAEARLNALKDAKPAKLATDAGTAEQAFVSDIETENAEAVKVAALAQESRVRADRAATAQRTAFDRVFSALRGDG